VGVKRLLVVQKRVTGTLTCRTILRGAVSAPATATAAGNAASVIESGSYTGVLPQGPKAFLKSALLLPYRVLNCAVQDVQSESVNPRSIKRGKVRHGETLVEVPRITGSGFAGRYPSFEGQGMAMELLIWGLW